MWLALQFAGKLSEFEHSTHPKLAKTSKMSIKDSHPAQAAIENVIVSDIDELTGRMSGWDNDWRQLETGRPQNRIEVIAGQHIVI